MAEFFKCHMYNVTYTVFFTIIINWLSALLRKEHISVVKML